MARQYLTFKVLPNGNLAVKATIDGKEEIRGYLNSDTRVSFEAFWYDLIESYSVNGSYQMVRPEDIGALTSAPIIGLDLRGDNLKYWWLENYMVINEFETLASGKILTFQSA